MSDFNPNQLSSPQSPGMISPSTIESADTISPVTKLFFISGDEIITTIVPPIEAYHELIIGTAGGDWYFTTGGNILLEFNSAIDTLTMLVYNPNTRLYYPLKSAG